MTIPPSICWSPDAIPKSYHVMLECLGEEYSIGRRSEGHRVKLTVVDDSSADAYRLVLKNNRATVFCGSHASLARALGQLLTDPKDGEYSETLDFTTNGIMLDVSRNAVMKPEHFKGWLRKLCLMGYTMAMLYTEDTYELPGEEYFGYQRGKYSFDELKDLDDYASTLGMEMIGCIQTLGHMEQVLKWNTYDACKDNEKVLLIDSAETYELIEKSVKQMSEAFGSRRLHVGMDEAFGMGRGNFLLKNGYQDPFEIFNRHIAKVIEICKKYGIKPMIWSDMYSHIARQQWKGDSGIVPDGSGIDVPDGVELVFWNYYSPKETVYDETFKFHRDMGFEPIMASGVWTWGSSFWYGRQNTEANVAPCVRSCRENGVKEIFFTMWGDDGGYCEYDSALAGLAFSAELCWGRDEITDPDGLSRRFEAICGSDYEAIRAIADMNAPEVASAPMVWDDPIQRLLWRQLTLNDRDAALELRDRYARVLDIAEGHAGETAPVDFDHILRIVRLLAKKVEINMELDHVYAIRDENRLQGLVESTVTMEVLTDAVLESFRRQWYNRNRPQGFEVIQIRLAGQRERYRELGKRLMELLSGTIDSIPELEELPSGPAHKGHSWRSLASASGIL